MMRSRLYGFLALLAICGSAAAAATPEAAIEALNRGDRVTAGACAIAYLAAMPFSPGATAVLAHWEQLPWIWIVTLRIAVIAGWLAVIAAMATLLLAARRRATWRRTQMAALVCVVGFAISWTVAHSRTPMVVVRAASLRVAPAPDAPEYRRLAASSIVLVREQRDGYALLSWPEVGWVSLESLRVARADHCGTDTRERQPPRK